MFEVNHLNMKVGYKNVKLVNTFLDQDTGEVLRSEKETVREKIVIDDKEEFVLMYAGVDQLLPELDKVSITLIIECCMRCELNSNLIALTKYIIQEIGRKSKLSSGTIRNSITRLVKARALIRVGSATYRVNPRYFWKGSSGDRIKTMQYIIENECSTC